MTPSAKVSDATSRLKLRDRHRKRNRAVRIAGWTAAAALLLGGVYLFAFSPVLAAKEIGVNGVHVLDADQVRTAARIAPGTPLARIDVGSVADRVATLPAVAGVDVTRVWPDQLVINITERQPRLAIAVRDHYLLADAEGVAFQSVEKVPAGLILVVADPNNRALLSEIGEVCVALSPATASKVAKVQAASSDSIELRLRDGRRVMWGNAGQSELKSQVVDALLKLPGRVFDVSAPSLPTRR